MSSAESSLPRLGLLRNSAGEAAHLVAALVEIGAPPVFEATSAELSAAWLGDGEIEVVVVGLDDDSDLSVLESLGSVRTVFDDLAASNGLSGWDRARWLRHLRAKILGAEVDAPPRPAGAQYIPVFAALPETMAGHPEHLAGSLSAEHAPDSRQGASIDDVPAEASVEVSAEAFPTVDSESLVGAHVVATFSSEPVSASASPEFPVNDQPASGLDFEPDFSWTDDAVSSSDADESLLEASAHEPRAPESSVPGWSGDGDEVAFELSGTTVADFDATDWLDPSAPTERRAGEPEAVSGLDELLDALRRDEVEAEPVVSAGLDPRNTPVTIQESIAPSPLSFDLSNLTLEPLEHERPLTGRAQFDLDPASVVEQFQPQARIVAPDVDVRPPNEAASSTEPSSAWLLAAGEAEVERVTAFLDALPATLSALLILVRPASAPWMGASLAFEDSGRLPLILGDDVMDLVGGRVVVMAPGERAGFNRSGQLTVQPGDYSLPEALGDWMSMRALAGRFGRNAGVIVFGRLRDEILEGAIELARAGGQVWFESSVYEQPNETVEAARAAGIAMRSGPSSELAGALREFLGR